MIKYKAIGHLMAPYFYQCWREFDGRKASEIVEESLAFASIEELRDAVAEFSSLDISVMDNDQLHDLLLDFGCDYCSESDGVPIDEWLLDIELKVIERLREMSSK